jgi:hypothetical protein
MAWDPTTQTLAIAGTHSISDVFVDALLPIGKALELTNRYKTAEAEFVKRNPKFVISHSLGASISESLAQNFQRRDTEYRMYGHPTLKLFEGNPKITSFRRVGDPIAMFDESAVTLPPTSLNPHSYAGYGTASKRSASEPGSRGRKRERLQPKMGTKRKSTRSPEMHLAYGGKVPDIDREAMRQMHFGQEF